MTVTLPVVDVTDAVPPDIARVVLATIVAPPDAEVKVEAALELNVRAPPVADTVADAPDMLNAPVVDKVIADVPLIAKLPTSPSSTDEVALRKVDVLPSFRVTPPVVDAALPVLMMMLPLFAPTDVALPVPIMILPDVSDKPTVPVLSMTIPLNVLVADDAPDANTMFPLEPIRLAPERTYIAPPAPTGEYPPRTITPPPEPSEEVPAAI